MMNNLQYYLNRGNTCPPNMSETLNKNNYLSEFTSERDKETVRDNLGISEIVKNLENKLNTKVIQKGTYSFDNSPVQDSKNILNSGVIYKTLQNYVTKSDLDDNTQELWINFLQKLSEDYNKIECELNQLSNDLKDYVNELRNNFNIEFNVLKNRIKTIEIQLNTFLQSTEGTALTDQFGDNEYLGVTQKTLTDAINRIWDKLGEISGMNYSGISLIVSPNYFVGEEGTNIHIQASTENTTGMFEKLQIFINGELLQETKNVDYFECDTQVNETVIITCKAKILGREYTKSKTIYKHTAFWIGSGNTYQDVMKFSNLKDVDNKFMRCNYDVTFNQDEYLFIILGDNLYDNFQRVDMNGVEVSLIQEDVIIEDKIYRIYRSENIYTQGTYNFDING